MAVDFRALASFLGGISRARGPARGAEDIGERINYEGLGKYEALRVAMAAERAVSFDYTRKRDSSSQHYLAHPYSARDGRTAEGGTMLYATEGKHGHSQIHGFILDRVRNVEVRPRIKFSPAWETEPESL